MHLKAIAGAATLDGTNEARDLIKEKGCRWN